MQLRAACFFGIPEHRLSEDDKHKRHEWSISSSQWHKDYCNKKPGFIWDELQDEITNEAKKFAGYPYPQTSVDPPDVYSQTRPIHRVRRQHAVLERGARARAVL